MSLNSISPTNPTLLQGVASYSTDLLKAQSADARLERNRLYNQRTQAKNLHVEAIEKAATCRKTSDLA